MSTLGDRIKASREAKGLLQSQLATLIDVKSANVISNWEKNVSKPDANKMVKICQVLDISLSYLLDYYGPEKSLSVSEDALRDELNKQIMSYVQKMTPEQKRALLASFQALLGPDQKH